jgi:Calcineurin-like phosphoesterase
VPQENRYLNIRSGTLMVVSDLHGDGEAFDKYLETFLSLRSAGEADRLLFLGDLIHGYGEESADASIRMILKVMELQEKHGAETMMMLLGNHEMPHIYSISLAKGEMEFTPRFERFMKEHREPILKFIKTLPFVARTSAGVSFCHAGPDDNSINRMGRLRTFNHDELLHDADQTLAQQENIEQVYETYAHLSGQSYAELAKKYLDVDSPSDPRYPHLMRALYISETNPAFAMLWDFLFTQNERGLAESAYDQICRRYLDALSVGAASPQTVCVSGHIVVPDGGHKIVNERHLRFASGVHARPRESGKYLLFDSQTPIRKASELVPLLNTVFK